MVSQLTAQLTYYLLIFVIGGAVLFVLLVLLLWKRKRVEDRSAYRDVLNEPEVITVFDPADYRESMERKHRAPRDL